LRNRPLEPSIPHQRPPEPREWGQMGEMGGLFTQPQTPLSSFGSQVSSAPPVSELGGLFSSHQTPPAYTTHHLSPSSPPGAGASSDFNDAWSTALARSMGGMTVGGDTSTNPNTSSSTYSDHSFSRPTPAAAPVPARFAPPGLGGAPSQSHTHTRPLQGSISGSGSGSGLQGAGAGTGTGTGASPLAHLGFGGPPPQAPAAPNSFFDFGPSGPGVGTGTFADQFADPFPTMSSSSGLPFQFLQNLTDDGGFQSSYNLDESKDKAQDQSARRN
jgi:hypothetical protein